MVVQASLKRKDSLEFKLTRVRHLCCGKLHLHALRIGAQSGFEADSVANLTQHAKVWKSIDGPAEVEGKLHKTLDTNRFRNYQT